MSHSSSTLDPGLATTTTTSLIANSRKRKLSVKFSEDNLNNTNTTMALASDTLFEKFGLWQSQENDANLANLLSDVTPDPFEDYDFNVTDADAESALDDLLASNGIKEEPMSDAGMDLDAIIKIENEDIFNVEMPAVSAASSSDEADSSTNNANNTDMSSLLVSAGAADNNINIKTEDSNDSIKSDCMWSSALMTGNTAELFNAANQQRYKRRRDVSLTLSECAEGILALKDFDVDMLNKVEATLGATPTLGSSPPFMSSTFGAYAEDTPMPTSEESDTETNVSEEDDDDEEIDVVSHDDFGSSARTRHAMTHRKTNSGASYKRIEAGRSLLRPQKKQTKQQQELSEKHKAILDNTYSDHCYFLAKPPTATTTTTDSLLNNSGKPFGMLTPNESSEDETDDLYSRLHQTGTTTVPPTYSRGGAQAVDKRKIAQAVQSLIKNNKPGISSNSNIKFKFRMKFKSTAPPSSSSSHSLGKVSKHHHHHSSSSRHHHLSSAAAHSLLEQQRRERRKSASKNAYCPPPNTQSKSPLKSHRRSPTSVASSVSSSSSSGSSSKRSSTESNLSHQDKCREIRDLHNSMERQRRVELRHNFDQLKDLVPELADADKASKLTILKKAMDYCYLLTSLDMRNRKEKEREAARNVMLKKKLLEAQQRHDRNVAGFRTSSGRISVWHGKY